MSRFLDLSLSGFSNGMIYAAGGVNGSGSAVTRGCII